ncbi:MAG: ribosome silencing factor [Planctomycetales bacterium]|nr:ribosome silencing factor [Planctomycetales bacterium]
MVSGQITAEGYVGIVPDITTDKSDPQRSLQLALVAAQTAADNRGRDIKVLDARKLTTLFDFLVIVTGTSRRQLHAMSEEIDHRLEDDMHDHRMGIEGYQESRWIVLDYGSVVIHLFEEEAREYYNLEGLWADAVDVDLSGLQLSTK